MAMSKIGSMRGGTAGGATKIAPARPKLGPMRKEIKKATNGLNKKSGQVMKPPVQVPSLKPTPTATQANKSLVGGNPAKAQRQLRKSVGLGRKQKLL